MKLLWISVSRLSLSKLWSKYSTIQQIKIVVFVKIWGFNFYAYAFIKFGKINCYFFIKLDFHLMRKSDRLYHINFILEFHFISIYFALFRLISPYFALFRLISVYSGLFRLISSLFVFISVYFALFRLISLSFLLTKGSRNRAHETTWNWNRNDN